MIDKHTNEPLKRKNRAEIPFRLKHYIIFTDTKETEKNYVNGMYESLSDAAKKLVTISVQKADTVDLVRRCKEIAATLPNYGEIWIVFDRDRVVNFDSIIFDAQSSDIHIAWSNPCIEIWFSAYWNTMETCVDSVSCVRSFKELYKSKTGVKYDKDDLHIYKKLNQYGAESVALSKAKTRHAQHIRDNNCIPSRMNPNSTLFELVEKFSLHRALKY